MMKVQKREVALGAIILLIVLAVYFPAMRGTFSLDDDVLITDNAMVNAPDGLSHIWRGVGVPDYYPLTYSLFWAEWRLWGLHASGYHVVNIVLHAIGVLLLWRILRRLRLPGAWAAALLYAIHPVCAGTVAWISEGKNTLSLVFYTLSILCFLKSETNGEETNSVNLSSPPQWYAFSLAAFVLALFSKSSVVMLPVVLFGCILWQRNKISRRDALRLAPFFAFSFIFGLITIWFQKNRAGAGNLSNTLDFGSRLAGAGKAAWFYFSKAILPTNLSFIYPQWTLDSSLASFLPDLAWVILLVFLFKFRKTFGRPALFALGYFLVLLFPVLGLFDMYFYLFARVADHLQYLALIGIVTLAVGALWKFTFNPRSTQKWQTPHIAVACLILFFSIATWNQAAIHADVELTWRDTLKKNPSSWIAHGNLAGILRDKRRPDEAVPEYRKALELNPDFANAHLELAGILAADGNIPEATLHFGEAARLKPKMVEAHYNYGVGLERLGKTEEAIAQYVETLNLAPTHLLCRNNLASLYTRLGAFQKAEEHLQAALQIKSDFPLTHNNYGTLLSQEGHLNDASIAYAEAIRLDPNFVTAYNNLANVMIKLDQTDDAIVQLKKALQIKPNYLEAHYNLGELLLRKQNLSEAAEQFSITLAIEPKFYQAHYKLGTILAVQGRTAEAKSHFNEALNFNPNYEEAKLKLQEMASEK